MDNDIYKDPQWQKKRLEIFERESFTCELCKSKDKTLHCHHKYYTKGAPPWDYPDSALSCLCEDCHAKVEELKKKVGELLCMVNPVALEAVFKSLYFAALDYRITGRQDTVKSFQLLKKATHIRFAELVCSVGGCNDEIYDLIRFALDGEEIGGSNE